MRSSNPESTHEETLTDIVRASSGDVAIAQAEALYQCAWGVECLMNTFKSVQLVVDDFLQTIPLKNLCGVIHCLASFGAQVNPMCDQQQQPTNVLSVCAVPRVLTLTCR